MACMKKFPSLEEKAFAKVVINLSQDSSFKETALGLEKPRYGIFLGIGRSDTFISDPFIRLSVLQSSICAKKREAKRKRPYIPHNRLLRSLSSPQQKVENWNTEVDEQCQRLVKGLPRFYKYQAHAWLSRVALEYLCYSRQQEFMFGVSRYFFMEILSREILMEDCRLDEMKLTQRMIKDDRLTVLQRYRIACTNYVSTEIPDLWGRLSGEEKEAIYRARRFYPEEFDVVLTWSRYMIQLQDHDKTVMEQEASCNRLAELKSYFAVEYGNSVAVVEDFKTFDLCLRQEVAIEMAFRFLKQWTYTKVFDPWFLLVLANEPFEIYESFDSFTLPYNYSGLTCFFLSEMNEETQLRFFKKAFESVSCDSILECILDWPHQAHFLPTIHRMWQMIPTKMYGQCLIILARKYSAGCPRGQSLPLFYKLENIYFDYGHLIAKLWEEIPEEAKRYLFHCFHFRTYNELEHCYDRVSCGAVFLSLLVSKSPLEAKDEALFRRICRDLPQKEKIHFLNSAAGKKHLF